MGKLSNEDMDSPEDADVYETKLRDGDLIIAYVSSSSIASYNSPTFIFQTDGLTDNVFNHEITSICSLVFRSGGSEDAQVKLISDRIIEYARACMNNQRRTSPFESETFAAPLICSVF